MTQFFTCFAASRNSSCCFLKDLSILFDLIEAGLKYAQQGNSFTLEVLKRLKGNQLSTQFKLYVHNRLKIDHDLYCNTLSQQNLICAQFTKAAANFSKWALIPGSLLRHFDAVTFMRLYKQKSLLAHFPSYPQFRYWKKLRKDASYSTTAILRFLENKLSAASKISHTAAGLTCQNPFNVGAVLLVT